MNQNSFWLVVANAGKALFYRGASPKADLEKFREMENEEARMQNQELETDSPGRVKTPTGGRAKRGETDPKGRAIEEFAVTVADYLDRSRGESKFTKLSMIAPPKFLGQLRTHIDSATEDAVLETVSKNLVEQDVEDAQDQLERIN